MTDWLQGKSAKQWVNEIGVKQLIRAEWETREAIPGQQPPTFICRCVIPYSDGPLEAEGSGKTKKDAEQLAAVIMLKDKLKMTPAKLMALNNSSKRMASSSSGATSRSSAPVGGGGGDGGDVSDTDDKDAEARANPVGELMAICDDDENEFQEPEYSDVNSVGPPHRRIFTVECKVKDVDDQEITFQARRYTKRHAKKIAAFRVLREMNNRGFTYSPHQGNEDGGDDDEDSMDNSTSSGVPSEVTSAFNVDDLKNGLDETLRRTNPNQMLAHEDLKLLKGRRNYCTDDSHKCLELCKDYPHAFAHLKKCESLDKVLEMDSLDSIPEGPLALLQEIARDIEIKLAIANVEPKESSDVIKLLELTFPFDFKFPVPKKAVVYGIGANDGEARENAGKAAINFLRNQLICAAD